MAVVKINAISVPDGAGEELEKRFAARAGTVDSAPGFLGFQLLRPVQGEQRYFVVTQWESHDAYSAWADGFGRAAHVRARGSANSATGADLLEFEVVLDVKPA